MSVCMHACMQASKRTSLPPEIIIVTSYCAMKLNSALNKWYDFRVIIHNTCLQCYGWQRPSVIKAL